MRRALGLLLAFALLVFFAYVSRFWPFALWADGEMSGLPPGGGLWTGWMWRLGLGDYDLLLWALAGFAALSVAQALWDRA